MYLKSIEIQGFKSFANKTVLQFHQGVTGIVGPNGSGKSNIADAVRWVLGEQKVKSLRGASMQDVIFAGTQLRKPQGFAHVAITLDNSDKVLPVDYTEVTVSRRLYRSGESEYMINGQAVRLKDVQELFYDTGIGREGYSIIGQGQIDAILNGRPEERRGLFDEAAGIVKFKRRRQIAEKKLEAERADLTRITDILSELSRRVEPLRRQSENAREYLRLRDEQKLYDLNLFLRETEALLMRMEETEEKRKTVSGDLETAKEEAEKLKSHYEKLDESLLSLETELSEKKEALQKAGLLTNNLENQISLANAQIEAEERSERQSAERLRQLSASIAEKKELALSYLRSLKALSNQLLLVAKKQAEESAELLPVASGELNALREKTETFSERIQTLLGLSDEALQAALSEEATAEKKDGAEAEDDEETEEPEWLREIRSKQSELNGISDRETRIRGWLSRSREELEARKQELRDLNRSLNDRQQAYHTAATKRESLKNIAERYEGYGQSIRRVMEVRDRVRGIHGVVADLIKTKKEYEVAVETALGGSIQNIVTDSEETAKVLIEHLKKNRFGRATFLPLSAIRGRGQKEYEAALSERGAVGLASSLTETKDTYRELNEYLLGRCLVVDSMDNAIAIARKFKHSLKIVTLDGELLSPGGSISGGTYKNSSSLIGRQREIDELKERMDEALREVDKLNVRIVETQGKISETEEEIRSFEEELREIGLEKNSLTLGIMSDMKLQYSGLSQKTEFIAENIGRLETELLQHEEERDRLMAERKNAVSGIEQQRVQIEELKAHIGRIGAETEKLSAEIEALGGKRDSLSSDRRGFFEQREELSRRTVELEKELMRIENQKEKEQQRFDSQTEYIWNEYELTASAAKEWYREDLGTTAELKSKAQAAKNAIRALGPVNIQALEEYKEVAERHEFLKGQHEDLVKSEQAILSIIEELDAGMKRQFNEKFAQIKEQFNEVFKLLFGGGQGTIELVREEGDDVLSAGIAIIAQPPGKKLQNMMQLSGGEKALTAIALLFAIQNLKPSPFCLLDEIEAALDDSNVSRFAQYLHKLTEHTQFILVTHRRGTMEAADRLYGVTMQEKGVTALVSVDLVSDQLEN
ncbi:MAG: chromosome segregation protein SMC [Eubacteriales bacterium]|nr:chromosome segregation protein SMC [Eubacteriales bacterium]